MLSVGDPAPWFEGRSSARPRILLSDLAGRYVFLSFFGSASRPEARAMLDELERHHEKFNILNACLCGVSCDPEDERLGRVRQRYPGIFYYWDFDRAVSRLYGAAPDAAGPAGETGAFQAHTLVLDPSLRVVAVATLPDAPGAGAAHAAFLLKVLADATPVTSLHHFAPVLALPHVFETDLCKALIDMYDREGGRELGVLQEVAGQTVRVHDHSSKRRADCTITDPALRAVVDSRLRRRIFPELTKAFHFHPTHIERYNVACYDSQTGGFFRAHRDDSTRGSAHRRFAVTINLNGGQFDGGELRFPEYGFRLYSAPTGGAVVFSCTLLHEVRPMKSGKRYAFLPFIYDEAAAQLRQANQQFLSPDLRSGTV